MIKYHIRKERLAVRHTQLHLPTHISKPLTQFKQKSGDVVSQSIFQLLSVYPLLKVRKSNDKGPSISHVQGHFEVAVKKQRNS